MKNNYAPGTWFHCSRSLTQEEELCSDRPPYNEQEVMASKIFLSDGRKTSWKSGPNAPSMVTQFKVHAPLASIHMKGRWSEGSSYEIKRKTQLGFYEILSKTRIEWEDVSLF